MKNRIICFFAMVAACVCAVASVHDDYRERMGKTEADVLMAKKIAGMDMTAAERDAMEFLYAYMSEPDMADRTPEFYLKNVRASLRAREEMPWGHKVPEREWRHFVLPVRVNNENLDLSREVFFEELRERVKGLNMEQAILETNHWLHEKATYKPSDARTSSPLSTVSQAIGRCGEESTFGVAALRSIGIPARQVYTPRWAHTDDNHAWVEVWCDDGKWHFLGACEPQPILDLAWFNAPATRGMMMNTNVYGRYDGPEEKLSTDGLITRINVTENYAPVRKVKTVVRDVEGKPVKGAEVMFCVYNYSEYYPVSVKVTGDDGAAESVVGVGDVIVWATDGKRFGMVKSTPGEEKTEVIVQDKGADDEFVVEYDIVPPRGGGKLPEAAAAQVAENDWRMAHEDSIRNLYVSTFATSEFAKDEAKKLGVDGDKLAKILVESRGNHNAIVCTLQQLPAEERGLAVELLLVVSEKDRRDIEQEVIKDHVKDMAHSCSYDEEVFNKYVLCPRVENEGLTAWRGTLRKALCEIPAQCRKDAEKLAGWVSENIKVSEGVNPQGLRMSPEKVWERRSGDRLGRDILYVALARSAGMAARIDDVTGRVQYYKPQGEWRTVTIGESEVENNNGKGRLVLQFEPTKTVVDPRYFSNFSISKIEGGKARQLDFAEDATWSDTFAGGVELEEGQYVLTSGQRLASGAVLARSSVFNVKAGEQKRVSLEVRNDDSQLQVIGALDAETIYHDLATGTDKSLLSTAGRGYYTVGIIKGAHEPSAHVLNDLIAVKQGLEKASVKIIMLFASPEEAAKFNKSNFNGLPDNLVLGVDVDGRVARQLEESLHLDGDELPIVAVADSFNRVVYCTTGYTIGTGERILQTLRQLE